MKMLHFAVYRFRPLRTHQYCLEVIMKWKGNFHYAKHVIKKSNPHLQFISLVEFMSHYNWQRLRSCCFVLCSSYASNRVAQLFAHESLLEDIRCVCWLAGGCRDLGNVTERGGNITNSATLVDVGLWISCLWPGETLPENLGAGYRLSRFWAKMRDEQHIFCFNKRLILGVLIVTWGELK